MKHFPALMKAALLSICVAAPLGYASAQTPAGEISANAENPWRPALAQNAKNANQLTADAPQISQRPKNILRRPAAQLKGDIKAVIPNWKGMMTTNDAFYGSLKTLGHEDVDKGELDEEYVRFDKIFGGEVFNNAENSSTQGAVLRDNIIYIPDLYYTAEGMITGIPTVRWKRADATTGQRLEDVVFGWDEVVKDLFLYSLTYDEASDIIYGLAYDATTENYGRLIKVDCQGPAETWRPKVLAELGGSEKNFMAGICFNPADNKLYGLKDNGIFYEIDLSDLNNIKTVELMEFDNDEAYYCYPMFGYPVAMTYSPYDHAFIFNYLGSALDEQMRMVAVDAESYEARHLGIITPMAYVGGLFCMDSYAPDGAPDRMKPAVVDFKNADLTGSYSITLPSTTFDGVALSGNLTLNVLLDGEQIYTGTHTPGETYSSPLTVEQGMHALTAYTVQGDLESPIARTNFHAGYDNPNSPAIQSLINGTLKWSAPLPGSVHGGYVDLVDLSYNVLIDGEKVNQAPIKANEYRLEVEGDAKRVEVSVVAISNSVESAPSVALSRVLGKGFDIPASFAPTQNQSNLFEVLDANHDGDKFKFTVNNGETSFLIKDSQYMNHVDDWLFLPPVYCDNVSSIYSITFKYKNAYGSTGNNAADDLDVCVGTDPTPDAMGTPIYSHESNVQPEYVEKTIRFTVSHSGNYYIGLHTKPGPNPSGYPLRRGVEFKDFKVLKEAGSTKAPGAPTDVVIEAAPKGDLMANVSAKLPTVDLNGDPLPADQVITLNVTCGENKAALKGKPGETVKVAVEVPTDGNFTIYAYPSSEEGAGMGINKRIYVGIDTPLPPANIRGVVGADNKSVTLTWDPVSEVGLNGGYVDPEGVSYHIYSLSSISQTRIGSADNKLTYDVAIGGAVQNNYYLTSVAVNEIGNSINGTYFSDILGTPHETPVKEEWPYSAFDYQKWFNNTSAPFNAGQWGHCTETASLGIGDGVVLGNGGALICNPDRIGTSEIFAPKVTTRGVESVIVKIRYWDSANTATLELWGRTFANQDPVKVGEIKPTGTNDWQEAAIVLPAEFAKQPWIQINPRAVFTSMTQMFLMDSYSVLQNTDFDFQVSSIEAPFYAFVGDKTAFNVVVTNSGAERTSGSLKVELLGDDNVLASQDVEISNLTESSNYEYSAVFEMLESYVKYSNLEVRATTSCTGDQNDTNNEKTVEFLLNDHTVPMVRDLKAERHANGNDAVLTWSEPNTEMKNFESFEACEAFGNHDEVGRWLNVDVDGKVPFLLSNTVRWEGDDQPCAWTVFDAEAKNTMNDERAFPHSGTRMLIARSIGYQQDQGEEPSRSAEFLVSPEVKGGSKVSFWINTFSTSYSETFEVWYSSTDARLDANDADFKDPDADGIPGAMTRCGSFKRLPMVGSTQPGVFTKSGAETWEYVEVVLPQNAKYFAIVYTSFGTFAGMVDDIIFEPVTPDKFEIDSYDIYVAYPGGSPEYLATSNTAGYTIKQDYNPAATYYVQTVVKVGKEFFNSANSNPAFLDGSGVDGVAAGKVLIGGAKGHLLVGGAEGLELSLYDLSGRLVKKALIGSDRESIPAEAGVYIARVGETTVKVFVR